MKIHDVEQGTSAWLELRAGIPTSSEFSKILTPTGKKSASATPYRHKLIAERLMGHPVVEYVSIDMDRGARMESEAVDFYEFRHDVDTKRVGFITNDAQTIGASPDRLVGDDGLLEIKCPAEHTHVGYLLHKPVDRKYYPQIMGQLWVTGRSWVDILSYHPEMPPAMVRVLRDEDYILLLAKAVTEFSAELEREYRELSNMIGSPAVSPLSEAEAQLELQPEDAGGTA